MFTGIVEELGKIESITPPRRHEPMMPIRFPKIKLNISETDPRRSVQIKPFEITLVTGAGK